jgi:hypothetical protein
MPLLLQERRFPPGRWSGMETPRDYRKFAEECRRLAKEAKDEEHGRILQQMAEAWLRLAAEAEQKGSAPPH